MIKDNRITEKIRMQFRAEFFNLPNHPNFGLPNDNISSGARGTITAVQDGRDIQFGLKLVW